MSHLVGYSIFRCKAAKHLRSVVVNAVYFLKCTILHSVEEVGESKIASFAVMLYFITFSDCLY